MAKKSATRPAKKTTKTTPKKTTGKPATKESPKGKPQSGKAQGGKAQGGKAQGGIDPAFLKAAKAVQKGWEEARAKDHSSQVPPIPDGRYVAKMSSVTTGAFDATDKDSGKKYKLPWIKVGLIVSRGEYKGLQPARFYRLNEIGLDQLAGDLQRFEYETGLEGEEGMEIAEAVQVLQELAKGKTETSISIRNREYNGKDYQDVFLNGPPKDDDEEEDPEDDDEEEEEEDEEEEDEEEEEEEDEEEEEEDEEDEEEEEEDEEEEDEDSEEEVDLDSQTLSELKKTAREWEVKIPKLAKTKGQIIKALRKAGVK